jgi:energy-coupling factor transport system ATP-binding protein
VLLLGPSGSGKSTLLHALAGVLGDDEGDATGALLVDGAAPADARGRTALMLQDPASQLVLTRVGDEVAFGCENLGVPRDEIWRRVGEALELVGLGDLPLDAGTATLSGGQQQRLALAGLLAMRPGALLLDEPTASLDPDGVVEVRDAVARVADATGATLVVVEHRVAVWRDLVDRVIVLGASGRVVADGPVDRVLDLGGAALARDGVWVPGHPPATPVRRRPASVEPLLAATRLEVGRPRGPVIGVPDASLAAGAMLAVRGRNGSGKSTLALTLAGLLPPVSGEVAAAPPLAQGAGASPARWSSRQLLTRIGTVFQNPEHQFLTSSVRAELEVGPRALGLDPAAIAVRVDPILDRLRLGRLADANPFTLSGGEQRRLSVATALATAPRVLVLDEPTFGQDSRTWSELVALLAEQLDAGTAVVAVSHDVELADALADTELVLA